MVIPSKYFTTVIQFSTVCLDVICSSICTTLLVIRTFYSPHAYFLTKVSVDFHAVCQETKANRGWTPLHLAAYFGYLDTVKLLMQVRLASWTQSNS